MERRRGYGDHHQPALSSSLAADPASQARGTKTEDREKAFPWLQFLHKNGGVTQAHVCREEKKNGFGERAIKRRKKLLGVISKPGGGGGEWVWRLALEKAPWEED